MVYVRIHTISKTSETVSSGFPNTRKLIKTDTFIVYECLEALMKQDARVFEIASH